MHTSYTRDIISLFCIIFPITNHPCYLYNLLPFISAHSNHSKRIVKNSVEWNYIKNHPTETLRSHLFTRDKSSYSKQAVELAIQFGADVNTQPVDSQGTLIKSTLLMHAVITNATEIAKWLCEHGATYSHNSSNGITPFLYACARGNKELATYFLSRNPACIDETDPLDKWTPLHYACMSGNQDLVKLLATSNQSLMTTKDTSGRTPLHIACTNGHEHLIQTFHKINPTILATAGYNENSFLYEASIANQLPSVKMLLTLHPHYLQNGFTPIMEAMLTLAHGHNHTELARFLSELKHSFNSNIQPLSTLDTMQALFLAGATTKLVAQWLTGTMPDSFPYCRSLLSESNSDLERIAPFINNSHPHLPFGPLNNKTITKDALHVCTVAQLTKAILLKLSRLMHLSL